MFIYVVFTVFLYQRGSSESKSPDEPADVDADPRASAHEPLAPWPVRRGGWVLKVYEQSLGLALLALFLISFALHAAGGHAAFNEEQRLAECPKRRVWNTSWLAVLFERCIPCRAEFRAIAAMCCYIPRLQRVSPNRNRGAPHSATGTG